MSRAYEEARELLRQFGGLLGRPTHDALDAEGYAYEAVTKTPLDLAEITATMSARPRAFGSAVRGSAAPHARGASITRAGEVVRDGARVEQREFGGLQLRVVYVDPLVMPANIVAI